MTVTAIKKKEQLRLFDKNQIYCWPRKFFRGFFLGYLNPGQKVKFESGIVNRERVFLPFDKLNARNTATYFAVV